MSAPGPPKTKRPSRAATDGAAARHAKTKDVIFIPSEASNASLEAICQRLLVLGVEEKSVVCEMRTGERGMVSASYMLLAMRAQTHRDRTPMHLGSGIVKVTSAGNVKSLFLCQTFGTAVSRRTLQMYPSQPLCPLQCRNTGVSGQQKKRMVFHVQSPMQCSSSPASVHSP